MSEAITLDGDLFDIPELQRAVNEGMDVAAELAAEDFDDHQSTWSEKSKGVIHITSNRFDRTVRVFGKIYIIVDHGRGARTIVARRARFLRFRSYKRKTTPNRIPAGQGGAFGEYKYRKQVFQKASTPSNISMTVARKYDKELAGIVQLSINDALD